MTIARFASLMGIFASLFVVSPQALGQVRFGTLAGPPLFSDWGLPGPPFRPGLVGRGFPATSENISDRRRGDSTSFPLFLDEQVSSAGSFPDAVASGDFNRDGIADLALSNTCTDIYCTNPYSTVSILLGNGDGSFQPHVDYVTGIYSRDVAVADFNADGFADLAVVSCGNDPTCQTSGTVSILRGNGDGTFQTAVDYATALAPIAIGIGDFNGDGKPDLAISAENCPLSPCSPGYVSVLLNRGGGVFQAHVDYGVDVEPSKLVIADFNHDHQLDIAITDICGTDPTCQNPSTGLLSVLLGNGNGTFQSRVDYQTGLYPNPIVAVDLDGDGNLDLVTGNLDSFGTESVLLGNGDGTFQSHADSELGFYPQAFAVGDFNADGKPDLALAGDGLEIQLGKNDGTFMSSRRFVSGYDLGISTGDFNRDGKLDLVLADTYDSSVGFLAGNGDGTFPTGRIYAVGPWAYSELATDLNRDGKMDLLVTNLDYQTRLGYVDVFLGKGNGSFKPKVQYPGNSDPISIANGDFNEDGAQDIVVGNFSDGSTSSVSILLGDGTGGLTAPVNYPMSAYYPEAIVVGDFNRDGHADIAVANEQSPTSPFKGNVAVFLGNGNGTLGKATYYTPVLSTNSIATADFNHDGKLDLVVAGFGENDVALLLGNGDGTFQSAVDYPTAGWPRNLGIGDFNHDSSLDVAATLPCVGDACESEVAILLGRADGTFQAAVNYAIGFSSVGAWLTLTDFNHDGSVDLAIGNGTSGVAYLSVMLGNADGTFQEPLTYPAESTGFGVVAADFNRDGSPDLVPLTQTSFALLLNRRGTRLGIQSSQNPSTFGQPVIFTTSVAASLRLGVVPSGTVEFWDGSQLLGTVPLSNGEASLTTSGLGVGRHHVKTLYSGDSNFNRNTVKPIVQTVRQ